ncbi:MAG: 50S ribosomal protein L9 [Chloroflexi bacterium]|nr:50S ribosomal protein L9 [Chloroflexota bacterium]
MKVIFMQDVKNVARAGEIKDVADGYGRNYLLPKKLAAAVGSQNMNTLQAQQKKFAKQRAAVEAELSQLGQDLEGKEITIKAKTGGKERLYGSITSADIAAELERAFALVVDKRKIELDQPIHQLGNYEIPVRLTGELIPKIKVNVLAEDSEEEKGAKPEAAAS